MMDFGYGEDGDSFLLKRTLLIQWHDLQSAMPNLDDYEPVFINSSWMTEKNSTSNENDGSFLGAPGDVRTPASPYTTPGQRARGVDRDGADRLRLRRQGSSFVSVVKKVVSILESEYEASAYHNYMDERSYGHPVGLFSVLQSFGLISEKKGSGGAASSLQESIRKCINDLSSVFGVTPKHEEKKSTGASDKRSSGMRGKNIFERFQQNEPEIELGPSARWGEGTIVKKLTQEGREEVTRGNKKCTNRDIGYIGDPRLRPITSHECAILVRVFVWLSFTLEARFNKHMNLRFLASYVNFIPLLIFFLLFYIFLWR